MCDPFIIFLRKMGFFILKIMIGVMVFCLAELPGYATSDATNIYSATSVTPVSKRLVCYGPSDAVKGAKYTTTIESGDYWCSEPGTINCISPYVWVGVRTSGGPFIQGHYCSLLYCSYFVGYTCRATCATNITTESPLTNCVWETV